MSKAKISELEGKCTGVLEEGENIKLKLISLHELWSLPSPSLPSLPSLPSPPPPTHGVSVCVSV